MSLTVIGWILSSQDCRPIWKWKGILLLWLDKYEGILQMQQRSLWSFIFELINGTTILDDLVNCILKRGQQDLKQKQICLFCLWKKKNLQSCRMIPWQGIVASFRDKNRPRWQHERKWESEFSSWKFQELKVWERTLRHRRDQGPSLPLNFNWWGQTKLPDSWTWTHGNCEIII